MTEQVIHAATAHRVVQAQPGTVAELLVDVVNTGDLVEAYTFAVRGVPADVARILPERMTLFPGVGSQVRVLLDLPATCPVGTHLLVVEVVPETDRSRSVSVDVDLSVSARPTAAVRRMPRRVRARRTGRFLVEIDNTGNCDLDVDLTAALEDSTTTARLTPESVHVPAGETRPVVLTLTGRRMLTGSEVDRTATLQVAASRAHSIPAMADLEVERKPDVVLGSQVVLRQRPILSRGMVTVMVLAAIVAVWAALFVFGLARALGGDDLSMTPAITFASSEQQLVAYGDSPVVLPPKTGPLEPGVGGSLSGVVRARSTQLPVGRILVEAFRDGARPTDKPSFVASTATLDDGTYTLAGLLPGDYRLRISGGQGDAGYREVWYPAAADRADSATVAVQARLTTSVAAATITGLPATVTGRIDTSGDRDPQTTTIVATAIDSVADTSGAGQGGQGAGQGRPTVRTTAAPGSGTYTLSGLLAPATYTLTYQTPGYDDRTATVYVAGGQSRLQPTIIPGAEDGSISGRVVDDADAGIGGVTITSSVDGEAVTLTTPTSGDTGAFTLGNLPVPGSYSLTFTAPGYGSTTEVVYLDAEKASVELPAVALGADTGTVRGRLVGLDGEGLGGASVTVGGSSLVAGTVVPTTTTVSSPAAAAGTFTLTGLPAPAAYTLTFTLDGFAPVTVPVSLPDDGPADPVRVTLADELGSIGGQVRAARSEQPQVGATVTLSNGLRTWSATTGSDGTFRVDGLPPGSYSATASVDGFDQRTAFLRVLPGARTDHSFRLAAASGG